MLARDSIFKSPHFIASQFANEVSSTLKLSKLLIER